MVACTAKGRFCLLVVLVLVVGPACGHDAPPDGWHGGRDAGDPRPGDPLEVVHVDVGEGDATLIVGPDGSSLLVDGGPAGSGAAIAAELGRRGIEHLDWMVATHPDADHIGGLSEVLAAGVGVSVAYGEGSTADTRAFAALTRALADSEAGGLRVLHPGDAFDLGQGAEAVCTASGGRLPDGSRVNAAGGNDRSLALHLRYGGFDYHLGGDLGGGGLKSADVETPLGALIGDMDVVHLHHHGSATSTNPAWLNATRPEVVVLSVGTNPYGHPHVEVVARVSGADPEVRAPVPEVVQTGQGDRAAGRVLGTFAIETDGVTYTLEGRTRKVDESAPW